MLVILVPFAGRMLLSDQPLEFGSVAPARKPSLEEPGPSPPQPMPPQGPPSED